MAFMEFTFQSDALMFEQQMSVLLPNPDVLGDDPDDLPVLYLLHGYTSDYLEWTQLSMLPSFYADMRLKLAIVMPACGTGWYANMKKGPDWFSYVADEVPLFAQSYLHVTADPRKTYVAGLSMGGFGAFKLALTYPERFRRAASFSGAVDLFPFLKESPDPANKVVEQFELFGTPEEWTGSENDLMHLLDADQGRADMPRLYQSVGTCDFLYDGNVRFRDKARALGYDLEYYEQPDTAHEWRFWNTEIKKFLGMIAPELERGL